jgi:hypothetical protein
MQKGEKLGSLLFDETWVTAVGGMESAVPQRRLGAAGGGAE